MTDEQINEVMRLVRDAVVTNSMFATGQIADMSIVGEAKYALVSYLRTIGEPAGYSLPAGSIGAKKFAQVGGGFTPVGLVFSRGESAMAITEHGRVYWDRDLVHPISGEPESVNAELLEALKECMKWQAEGEFGDPLSEEYWSPAYKEFMGKTKEAIARAESDIESSPKPATFPAMKAAFRTTRVVAGEFIMAFKFRDIEDMDRADDEWRAAMAIETPAKVSPCAGHAVQQEADETTKRSSGLFKCWICLDTGFIPKAAVLPEPPDVKCPNGCKPKKGGA